MSNSGDIDRGLLAALTEATGDQKSGCGRFYFRRDFPGFDGHFDNFPLVPGVCLLRAAELLIRQNYGEDFVVRKLSRVKFFRPVVPEDTIDCEYKITPGDEGQSCRVSFAKGQEKIAQIIMEIQ